MVRVLACAVLAAGMCACSRPSQRPVEGPAPGAIVNPPAASHATPPAPADGTVTPGRPGSDVQCDLASGAHSGVEAPFVAVVRDARVYEALRARAGAQLAPLEPGFFPDGIVVAAFAGARPTAGYSVSIASEPWGFRVTQNSPPKDALLAQVVTTPFAVVAHAVAPPGEFTVRAGEEFAPGLRTLAVRSGALEVSGGIAGSRSDYALQGSVTVSSLADLTTLLFEIDGQSAEGAARLVSAVTLLSDADERLSGALPQAGTFLPPPCRNVLFEGLYDAAAGSLTAELTPGACAASDAFRARGQIVATAL